MKRTIITLSAALMLGACASAAKPGAMVPDVKAENIINSQSTLFESVSIGEVDGGKETNPLWTSEVSTDGFAEALKQTFKAHAFLATDKGKYRLDAELLKLKQPFAGTNLSVTSDVKYVLTDIETNEVVFDELINEKYTAKFGDSVLAVKRLQLANEGSIKSNISTLIDMMIKQVNALPTPVAILDVSQIGG